MIILPATFFTLVPHLSHTYFALLNKVSQTDADKL